MSPRTDRELLIELLVGVQCGRISYSDFAEAKLDSSGDPTVGRIWSELEEEFLDDLSPDRPIKLIGEAVGHVDRSLLLLRAGWVYAWPKSPPHRSTLNFIFFVSLSTGVIVLLIVNCFISAIGIAIILLASERAHMSRYRTQVEKWREQCDIEVWPFQSRNEYDRVLAGTNGDELR